MTLFRWRPGVNAPHTEGKAFPRTIILQAILEADAEVNAPPSPWQGTSAAVAAVRSRNVELTKSLLQRGLDPNSHLDVRAALGQAVFQGSVELVSLLIEAGADLNKYCDTGGYYDTMTAIQVAAVEERIQIARRLLDAGADFSTPSNRPLALQYAVKSNCTELVQLLLAKGADPNAYAAAHKYSKTALEEAMRGFSVNVDIVKALIDAGADANNMNRPDAARPLVRAAAEGNVQVVHLLLKAGACTHSTSEDKETALQAAVGSRNVDLIQILIDAGADVNAPAGPMRGRTALQIAAEESNIQIVKLLLSHGADVNAPAGHSHGITALQGAMMHGNLKIVLMLLKAEAQVNTPPASKEGRMALDAAAEHGRLDIVSLLLKNDDDAEAIEIRCKRAARFAASNGRHVIAKILREYKTGQGFSG